LKINRTQIIQVGRRLGVVFTPDEAQGILDDVMKDADKMHKDKAYMNKVVDIITEKLNRKREGANNEYTKK